MASKTPPATGKPRTGRTRALCTVEFVAGTVTSVRCERPAGHAGEHTHTLRWTPAT